MRGNRSLSCIPICLIGKIVVAIIEQCCKDARHREDARWCLEYSPVIQDLCALLDLPHTLIVNKVCYD